MLSVRERRPVAGAKRLPAAVELAKCVFGLQTLADTVDIEGIIPTVLGKWAVAVLAEAVNVALAAGGIHLEACMVVRVKWAEVKPSFPGWPGAVGADQVLHVVLLVEVGYGYPRAVPPEGRAIAYKF